MEQFINPILQIVATSVLGALTLFLLIINKKVAMWWINNIWNKYTNNGHQLRKKDMSINTEIKEDLVELRARVDSDRACLFMFHNGTVFTTQEPIWKVSCIVESCAEGIEYISDMIKDVKVSSIIETIHVLWPDTKLGKGIELISPEYCGDCNTNCKKIGRRIIFIDVNKLEDGYSKILLIKQGIKYLIDVPIFDDNGNMIGFISTNYNRDMNVEEIKETAYKVCKRALGIEFMLMKNKRK